MNQYNDDQYRGDNELIQRFIHRLGVLYHQMVPLQKLQSTLHQEYPQFFTSNQDLILNDELQSLINDKILTHVERPTKSYCFKFIKVIIDTLGRYDREVNEYILDKFISNQFSNNTKQDNDGGEETKEFCFKSYYISESDKWVVLKNQVVYNLVGMTTWGAAYLLSDFITANISMFQTNSILELGSGTGLIGVILDQLKPTNKVVLTDYSPFVLNNLIDNLNLNNIKSIDLTNEIEQEDSTTNFIVSTLDWELEMKEKEYQLFNADIIVGADIVYDPQVCKHLVSVLHQLCTRNRNTVSYIASTIRNQDTFDTFQQELKLKSFTVEEISKTIPLQNPSPFIYDRSQIVLNKIQLL